MIRRICLSFLFVLFLLFAFGRAEALKEIDSYIYNSDKPFKIELRKVQNAQLISVKSGQTIFNARLSGIVCNEYTIYNEKYSTSNTKYFIEDTTVIKLKGNRDATNYVEEILKANKDNLYFLQQGGGFYYCIVGELYIGNTKLTDLLVQKGYCRRP